MIDFDHLPDAVVALDARRCFQAANAAAGRLTGYEPEQMLGQPVGELLQPRGGYDELIDNDGWPRSAALRSVRRIPEHRVLIRRADGSDAHILVSGQYQRNDDGTVAGAVLVLREPRRRRPNVTDGIEVISTVSHELRSPLTSVKGYTSLLLNRWERLADDQKRTMLEQVQHDADRVTRLITELLDISRLESGRLVLRRQMVDLVALVNDVIGKVRMMETELDVEVAFDENFPPVYADPDKIEQVLTNLVENAAKYAQPTGMRVSGDVADGKVSVSVADKGEGIPEPDLRRVFTKFFRRSETRPTGSGLGLWISRGLVEAHGGQLVAESEVGRGSIFRFSLPLTRPEELG